MFGNDNMFGAGGVSTGFYDKTIDQSLRFNDNDSAYLSRTPASAGNRKTWTWSGWVKRGNLGTNQSVFSAGDIGNLNDLNILFDPSDKLTFWYRNGGNIVTSQVFRDVGAWYHIMCVWDTPQATSSNRMKIYINGEQVTSFTSTSYPSQNLDGSVNSTSYVHSIGRRFADGLYTDGYLAEVNFVDGQALTADSFGEFKSGVWIPKAYSGSYGTNGFHLEFANSGSLGADTSGNGNTWSAYNLASTDQMLDSPTNNYPTLNTLNKGSNQTTQQGNMYWYSASNYQGAITSTMAFPSSGKWYVEGRAGPGSYNAHTMGFATDKLSSFNNYLGYTIDGWAYDGYNGKIYHNNSSSSYGSSYGDGAIVSMLFDADAGTVTWWLNGTSQGTGVTGLDTTGATTYLPAWGDSYTNGAQQWWVNFGQDGSFVGKTTSGGYTDANGIGDFYYAPPTDYLALCTANLPEPAISPADDASPSDHFNTVLYTGAGSDNQSITGVGFSPDMTWIKMRNLSSYHHIQDVTFPTQSGYYNYLSSNASLAYQNDGPGYGVGFKSFDADGFTIDDNSGAGGLGGSGYSFVSWNWKANGSGVSNTDGSTTSTVSANTDAGFSIVRYTGTGSATTVGHGLDEAPDMIIIKAVDYTTNWPVYHSSLGATHNLILDQTVGQGTTAAYWNNTEPTSSVFTINNAQDCNRSGNNYVAYCFSNKEGYSKFGKYTGNGSADGTFVYTGFKPAFVLSKRVDVSGYSWAICDNKRSNYNLADEHLYANVSDSEYTTLDKKDLLSNGFKHRTNLYGNLSGGTYIYMAFAENPFKYTTAR